MSDTDWLPLSKVWYTHLQIQRHTCLLLRAFIRRCSKSTTENDEIFGVAVGNSAVEHMYPTIKRVFNFAFDSLSAYLLALTLTASARCLVPVRSNFRVTKSRVRTVPKMLAFIMMSN